MNLICGGGFGTDRDRPLNRSPLFVARAADGRGPILLLDRFEFALDDLAPEDPVYARVVESLQISAKNGVVDADTLIELLCEQFDAAAEFVYGHPIWQAIRNGSRASLVAYMLETRHYLAAAAGRMAPSIHVGMGLAPLTLLLSRHLLEEWDHERFFTEALAELGCPSALTRSARPLPTTLEWIHFARVIAAKSPLNAAACSGFMEHSSTETEAVAGWHRLLEESGLLPARATSAIFGHFETDLGFDHAANWQRAIRIERSVTVAAAQDALNDVSTLAEMIYRWLDSLVAGVACDTVTAMQLLDGPVCASLGDPHPLSVRMSDGLPVFPSTFLSAVAWGPAEPTPAMRIVTAASYGFGHVPALEEARGADTFAAVVSDNLAVLRRPTDVSSARGADDIAAIAAGWLCAIDGHELWSTMLDAPTDALIAGYFLENYHYLASATRHIGPAIAATTDPAVRRLYIDHLSDELEHCDILREKLVQVAGIKAPEELRPLPTTVAFVGYLQMLARSNWRAYVIVSAFLQSSLSLTRQAGCHAEFYAQLGERNAKLAGLVQTMALHDEIDAGLEHDEAPMARLTAMLRDGPATRDELAQAAIAPSLAWSFLDGILRHYACGSGAVLQRAGWHAR